MNIHIDVPISSHQAHRDRRLRRALGICVQRIEDEVAGHVAELDYIDARTDELLALIHEKRARVRELTGAAWRLTARIERKGVAHA